MQWPGTSRVLEEAGGAGAEAARPAFSALGLSSKVYAAAALPCRKDPELFFAESPAEVEVAKSLCGGCAVRAECLAGALARSEPWGVWGGELFLRGQILPRKRPRGRPRKDAVAA